MTFAPSRRPVHRPKYQKHHYEDAAEKCATALPTLRAAMIEVFVDMFRPDNPRFDAARFRAVASGEPWKATRQRRVSPPPRHPWA